MIHPIHTLHDCIFCIGFLLESFNGKYFFLQYCFFVPILNYIHCLYFILWNQTRLLFFLTPHPRLWLRNYNINAEINPPACSIRPFLQPSKDHFRVKIDLGQYLFDDPAFASRFQLHLNIVFHVLCKIIKDYKERHVHLLQSSDYTYPVCYKSTFLIISSSCGDIYLDGGFE